MAKLLLSFVLFYLTTLNGYATFSENKTSTLDFETYQIKINGINFRIDPRIELFNIVAMQFGHNGMTLSNIPYKKESLDYFTEFSDHQAPQLLLDTWKKGWGVDDPIFFLLYLDENFNIMEGLPEKIVERGGGMEHLQKLAKAFRNFALQSDFFHYFDTVKHSFYKQVLNQTAYHFRDFKMVGSMENYYGEKADSYNLILNLMGDYGNFGRAFHKNEQLHMYAIVQTRLAAGSLPTFIPSANLTDMILHEFSHGFVNPHVDSYAKRIAAFDSLYAPIEESMKFQAYHSWHTVVNEHIVRANVIRIIRQKYGKELTNKMYYRYEMGRRFIYLDALDKKLNEYDLERDRFTTFREFVPQLLTVLEQLPEDYVSTKQKKVEQLREPNISEIPKPYSYAKDSTTVFIMGTNEKNAEAQKTMHDWVKSYRNMISDQIRIMTDKEAMQLDLSQQDLVLFGTPDGNLLLKIHASKLPVTVTEKAIITNKILKGDDLQLVTSWVNPYENDHIMVVYTAQKTESISNFQMSPVKENFHYWVAQNTITLDQGDYVKWGEVWRPNPGH